MKAIYSSFLYPFRILNRNIIPCALIVSRKSNEVALWLTSAHATAVNNSSMPESIINQTCNAK